MSKNVRIKKKAQSTATALLRFHRLAVELKQLADLDGVLSVKESWELDMLITDGGYHTQTEILGMITELRSVKEKRDKP